MHPLVEIDCKTLVIEAYVAVAYFFNKSHKFKITQTNFFFSILFVTAFGLFAACNSNQASGQILKDDAQRKEIMTTIVHNPSYINEMMQQMMSSDSAQHMMGNSGMMNMMMGMMMNNSQTRR